MGDADLQVLRRRAASTGAPDDRAALLRARVRAGELAVERVELAAYCGDEGALQALPPLLGTIESCCFCEGRGTSLTGRGSCPRCLPVEGWLDGLRRWAEAPIWAPGRAGVILARLNAPEWMAEQGWWIQGRERGARGGDGLCHISLRPRPEGEWRPVENVLLSIEAAEDFLACPCDEHLATWRGVRTAVGVDRDMAWVPWPIWLDEGAIWARFRWLTEQPPERLDPVRRALLPWALGERDPVAERVAARG